MIKKITISLVVVLVIAFFAIPYVYTRMSIADAEKMMTRKHYMRNVCHKGFKDFWGEKVCVNPRDKGNDVVEFTITSSGMDGKFGTWDDISTTTLSTKQIARLKLQIRKALFQSAVETNKKIQALIDENANSFEG